MPQTVLPNIHQNNYCYQSCGNNLYSGADFAKLFTEGENTQYISESYGSTFFESLNIKPSEQQKFLSDLEQSINFLKSFEFGTYQELGFEIGNQGQVIPKLHFKNFSQISIEFIGAGHHGMVYRLQAENCKAYALKIFYQRESEVNASGPWSETVLGVFSNTQNINNLPKLCLANPANSWLVNEFVDRTYNSPTPFGPSWQDLGLINLDHFNDSKNEILTDNNVRIRLDYGHLGNNSRECIPNDNRLCFLRLDYKTNRHVELKKFQELAQANPDLRSLLISKLSYLKIEDRISALRELLQYKECYYFPLNDFIFSKTFAPEDTLQLAQILLDHPEPSVRSKAVFSLKNLNNSQRESLYNTWLREKELLPFLVYLGERKFDEMLGPNFPLVIL